RLARRDPRGHRGRPGAPRLARLLPAPRGRARPAQPGERLRPLIHTRAMSKLRLPEKTEALPGRAEKMAVPARHHVKGTPLAGPFPEGTELAMFGMGCFWGAEKKLWQPEGVYSTAVGYAAGVTPNPTYREVCSGLTGHSEVVR